MSEPTIVCVLGMHRGGTSLVARILHVLGLELGPEEHLMPASPANPAGHWEHVPIQELNDEILERMGGTWSDPPELATGWESIPELDELRRQAREIVDADFSGTNRWGFKDPRSSLTLPFWQRILPPMRYIICLRNPVDVAFSLKARDEEPLPFEQGVELWLTYVRAALTVTAGHPQRTLFYEDLMADPEPAIRQLGSFIGNDESEVSEAYARAAIRVAVSETLWHHRTPLANVIDEPRLPFHVKAMYLALRQFAVGPESVGLDALDLLGQYARDAGVQRADLERRVAQRRADLDAVIKSRSEQQQAREALERQLVVMRETQAEEKRRHQALEAELAAKQGELEATRTELEAELESARAELEGFQRPAAEAMDDSSDKADSRFADEVRGRAFKVIPDGATVLVVSKGDEKLIQLGRSRGLHFPLGPDARYLGYHPAGDTAAIAQLEALRAAGADHLLVPATAIWWLDHYQGFRRHLETRYVRLFRDETCAIYELRAGHRDIGPGPFSVLRETIASLRIRSGRDPSVLDWGTDLHVSDQLPEIPVVVPPASGDLLPYIDESIDIVLVSSTDELALAEARRVAARAVIRLDPVLPDSAELEWAPGASGGWGEDVSVAILPGSDGLAWNATLTAFAETLNDGFAGELVVAGTPGILDTANRFRVPVRQIEVAPDASVAQRTRDVASAVSRRVHVFVTAPAIPLPDWLPSILTLFSRHPDAGVVGARVVSDLGTLEEAGGIIGPDGSRHRRGEGDQNPDRPEYCFVKRVDFCSQPLLATSREVFDRLEGFSDATSMSEDPVADFSLRAGRSGAPVYYQPLARMVRIGNDGQ